MQENNNQIQPLTGNIHYIYISYKEQMVSTRYRIGQSLVTYTQYSTILISCNHFHISHVQSEDFLLSFPFFFFFLKGVGMFLL